MLSPSRALSHDFMNLSLIRNTLFFSFICWQQSYADIPTILPIELGLSSTTMVPRSAVERSRQIAQAGQWRRAEAWRSTWECARCGLPWFHKNLVVEVTFRFGDSMFFCYRNHRSLLSAWANTDNDFIETGLLLQHIERLLIKLFLKTFFSIGNRYRSTALLEIVDDEAFCRWKVWLRTSRADPSYLVSIQTGGTCNTVPREKSFDPKQ